MNGTRGKILAAITILFLILGWAATLTGIGSFAPLKDQIKLGLDIKGGVYVVMEAQTDAQGAELKKLMEQTQAVIEERVNQMGLSEPVVTIEGENRIRVELPGAENAEDAIESIGRTAQLQFVTADGQVVLDGSMIEDAGVAQDQQKGGYAVSLDFDREGTAAFADATRRAFNGQIVATAPDVRSNAIMIVLDGQVISAPVVENVITNGEAIITAGVTGGFSQEEAVNLAALIRGGALPVSLTEVDTSVQTARVGVDALESAVIAGIIGLIALMLLMLLFYRIMGVAANLALLLYVLIVLWVMVALGSVLTLPGIAGMILAVGMAVDANVIIFSRIKEEICQGKTIRVSVQTGFRRALSTILDSQITTMIAALVLYQFGSGTVRGFAMTLMIGILASVFSAVIVTNLLLAVLTDIRALNKKRYFGVSEDNRAIPSMKKFFHVTGHRRIYYIVTVLVLVIGLGSGGIQGFNYGIDFTGGTMLQMDLKTHQPMAAIREVLDRHDIAGEVVYAGENQEQVIIRTIQSLDNEERKALVNSMEEAFSVTDEQVLAVEQFGPSVGRELRNNAIIAVLIASALMLVYIIFRFEWRFGVAAIAGVVHDVLMVLAFYGIFRVTINSPFIAGVLTVVGYSINDTIVVFDRIRENLGMMKKSNGSELVDLSINQTLGRSLMTSITTLLVMIPLFILSGPAIREFVLPLMVGVIVGAASSIFIASPIYYDLSRLTGGPRYRSKKARRKAKE